MKRYFLYAFAALMFPFFMSCSDPFDDSAIWDQIEELKTRVQALEAKVADNVSAIQSMVSLGSIAKWDYDSETGKGVITLVDGKTITVDQTITGYSLITVTRGADGVWYWAICKDGVSTPLEVNGKKVPVSVTPALKISDDNEWLISVDGGVTWVSTGIEYQQAAPMVPGEPDKPSDPENPGDTDIPANPENPGDTDQPSNPEVVFFKSAETDGNYLILTLADDSVIKVAIVGEATFEAASEILYFSRVSMTKSVALTMVNVDAYTITEVPEGWKANIEGEGESWYMNVTSPADFEVSPKSGTVKALAVFENGLPAILSLDVIHEPMISIKYVNGKVSVSMSEHTGEDFNGYVLKGWKRSEYTTEAAVAWLNSDAAVHVPFEGAAEYELEDIVDSYDPAVDYMVFAAPYLPATHVAQGTLAYMGSDIQSVVCKPSAEWKISDIKFDSATLSAVMNDDKYYAGFMKLEDWTNFGCENMLESLATSSLVPLTAPSYHGSVNMFPDGESGVKVNPATEYVVWYLPYKEDGRYADADFVLHTFTTPDVKADASIAAPQTNISNVTISGFTADVTPAAGAYKTYAAIVLSTAIPEADADVVKYLININDFSSGQTVKTVTKSTFSSADEVHLLAVSVSEEGGYGAIVNQVVELESITYTDELGLSVTDIEYGLGTAEVTLNFIGNPESITYVAATYTFYTDEAIQEFLALEQYPDAVTKKVSQLNGAVQLTGLTVGAEHTFYAVVKGAGYKASKLYKYTFTPTTGIDYLTSSSSDYNYGKPEFTGSMSINGSYYTLTLNVNKPSQCVKYWLMKGDREYFLGDPWGDSDKIVTKQFDVAEYTSSETGLVYEFMNNDSRIYMVWLDDQGRYHAVCEFNPKG